MATARPIQVLSNTGNWLNYVATLLVVEKLAHSKGIYLSIVLVIHFLPSFVLFPIAGVLADRQEASISGASCPSG